MNFESLKNITVPIEAEDNKDRANKLDHKIEQISVVYATKKWQELKQENPDYKFSEALKTYSLSESIILGAVIHLEDFNPDDYQEKIDVFLREFEDEVNEIVGSDDLDLSKITDLVSLKENTIADYLEVSHFKRNESNDRKEWLKIIKFNQVNHVGDGRDKRYQKLIDLGFSKLDQFLEVHFEDFYRNDEKNISPELIRNDLAAIAKYIVKEKPETAAVIGRSWLLDTPIANRLGFTEIEDDSAQPQNDFTTWLQFVDKSGEIDQKRFNKFLETGELPFTSVKAYIPVEEFLRKYLPDNLKGRVILKEIDKDKEQEKANYEEEVSDLRDSWNFLLKNNSSFEIFSNNKTLNKRLDLLNLEDKEKYLAFFKKMFEHKIDLKDLFKYKEVEIKEIDKRLQEQSQISLYKNKEVIID